MSNFKGLNTGKAKAIQIDFQAPPKYIKDGKVAVIYSPLFGAGWYSWYKDEIGIAGLFDPDIVNCLLSMEEGRERNNALIRLTRLKWPKSSFCGVSDLEVAWVLQGQKFRIREYDGSEKVILLDDDDYIAA